MSPIAQIPRGGGDILALGESVKAPSDANYRIVTKKREQNIGTTFDVIDAESALTLITHLAEQ